MTDDPWPELDAAETWVTDTSEIWLRQVKPDALVYGDEIGSAAFGLATEERGSLRCSGALKTLQTPAGAYQDAIDAGVATVGTWGVAVEEIHGAGFRCIDDHESYAPSPKGHASLAHHAVAQLSDKQRKARRKELANAATVRGCLHRPTAPT